VEGGARMKRFTLLLTLLLLSAAFIVALPGQVHASTEAPTPGKPYLYDPLKSGDNISFVDNNAYKSDLVHENYQFFSSMWGGYNNQRVSVSLFVSYGDVYSHKVDINKVAKFTILQQKDWTNKSAWKDPNHTVHSETVQVSFVEVGHYVSSYYEVEGYYANASFLTSSSDFYPGMFEIKAQVSAIVLDGEEYKTGAVIYGIYTPGQASVKNVESHDWSQNSTGYAETTIAFSDGVWNVKLWYIGDNLDEKPPVSHGTVNTTEDPAAYIVHDFGNFSNTVTTLRYNFTENSSSGVYLWIMSSSWGGTLLTSYSWTVYNNRTTTNNGTYTRPEITITREGTFQQGASGTFFFHAKDSNPNCTTVDIWILAWYGNNKYQMPDPSLNLIVYYFYPITGIPNGGEKSLKMQFNEWGNLNFNIFVKDPAGMGNITYAQYYIDKPSGAGYGIYPSWFMWPWTDTTHLILLAAGAILALFTRNPLWRLLGLLLIAISFVDFSYLQLLWQNYGLHLKPGAIG